MEGKWRRKEELFVMLRGIARSFLGKQRASVLCKCTSGPYFCLPPACVWVTSERAHTKQLFFNQIQDKKLLIREYANVSDVSRSVGFCLPTSCVLPDNNSAFLCFGFARIYFSISSFLRFGWFGGCLMTSSWESVTSVGESEMMTNLNDCYGTYDLRWRTDKQITKMMN